MRERIPVVRARNGDGLYCLGALLNEIENLVKLCGEEIECGENAAVGPEIVPWMDDLSGMVAGQEGTATAHCFMTSW